MSQHQSHQSEHALSTQKPLRKAVWDLLKSGISPETIRASATEILLDFLSYARSQEDQRLIEEDNVENHQIIEDAIREWEAKRKN